MLLPSLNDLLEALDLPFTLDTPTDLTPSLLLAILESLINARLPIPNACDVLRGGTDTDEQEQSVDDSQLDLAGAGGVSVDGWAAEIGLGEASSCVGLRGGEESCRLKRNGSRSHSNTRSLYSNHHSYGDEEATDDTADFSTSLLRPSPAHRPAPHLHDPDPNFSTLSHITDVPRHPLVHSPEPSLSLSHSNTIDLSTRARSVSSHTSVGSASDDTTHPYDRDEKDDGGDGDEEEYDHSPIFRPMCIHELEDPSYIRALAGPSSSSFASHDHTSFASHDQTDNAHDHHTEQEHHEDTDDPEDPLAYAPPTPTPRRVRLSGWIQEVDTGLELSRFAALKEQSRMSQERSRFSEGQSRLSKEQSQPQLFSKGK
ncbi:hypothetical protein HYDPIDRAFT_44390 [Hydnomerulius pinastri MD-312]|uniref:Uncharacterized protein n=1 Tax=Hydnomerulius pinastri MD-312 TaxID=994086 RepID=A0A0C9W7A7_9AGAM|nr:hypothetical protein HYDPIDRAFT_44390 [Hydnomerulius pinastri MD-312]